MRLIATCCRSLRLVTAYCRLGCGSLSTTPRRCRRGPAPPRRPTPRHLQGPRRPATNSDGAKVGLARSSRGLGAAAAARPGGPVDPALSGALSPKCAEDLFGRTAVTGSRAFGSERRGPRLTGLTRSLCRRWSTARRRQRRRARRRRRPTRRRCRPSSRRTSR